MASPTFQQSAYRRDQQSADFQELARIRTFHGRQVFDQMLDDAQMEANERESEDARNCPRGERRPAIPTVR